MEWTAGIAIATPEGDYIAQPDADFTESVKAAARQAGLTVFRVLVGGVEIRPPEAPATVRLAMANIQVLPYDRAG